MFLVKRHPEPQGLLSDWIVLRKSESTELAWAHAGTKCFCWLRTRVTDCKCLSSCWLRCNLLLSQLIVLVTLFIYLFVFIWASQVTLVVKNPPTNAVDIRDAGLIPGSGRFPGGGHGNPLQYSCLENPMNRGAWWATVLRVAQSWTWLNWFSMFVYCCLNLKRLWHLEHLLVWVWSSLSVLLAKCGETFLKGYDNRGKWLWNVLCKIRMKKSHSYCTVNWLGLGIVACRIFSVDGGRRCEAHGWLVMENSSNLRTPVYTQKCSINHPQEKADAWDLEKSKEMQLSTPSTQCSVHSST